MPENEPEERRERRFAETTNAVPGVLVVLFNPSENHIQNLLRLQQLCKDIVAIDNSLSSNSYLCETLEAKGVEVIVNSNRGGLAGAYNRGFDRLIQKKCTVLFIFDQDSEIPDNYFQEMMNACLRSDDPYFLIGPKVLDINIDRYLPAHLVERFGMKRVPVTGEDAGLLRCSSIISSGSVIPVETYRFLGPFAEEYFIDQVDTEYCFRATCKAVPIYIHTSVTLRHELGKRIQRKALFVTVTQWNMSPLRQYYSSRNCILVSRRYGWRFPLLVLVNILTLQQLVSVVLYEESKYRKLVAIMAGCIDGVLDRGGSFEKCWPRISAFCTRSMSIQSRIAETAPVRGSVVAGAGVQHRGKDFL